jgi:transcriptional regulator with XRE-family HTH domain
MNINDNILAFNLLLDNNPQKIISSMAGRVKRNRLELNLTQQAMAKKAGMSFPSYRRFEATGEIAFKSLVKIAVVLNATEEFGNLFTKRQYRNIDEVIAMSEPKIKLKKRGRINQ